MPNLYPLVLATTVFLDLRNGDCFQRFFSSYRHRTFRSFHFRRSHPSVLIAVSASFAFASAALLHRRHLLQEDCNIGRSGSSPVARNNCSPCETAASY